MKLQLQQQLSLSLTPQLTQAIRLLQLPSIELCQEIDTMAQSNPLLEVEWPQEPEPVTRRTLPQSIELPERAKPITLREALHHQLSLISSSLHPLLETLIDGLDERGYLLTSLEDCVKQYPQYPLTHWEKALCILQSFEPNGVGARNLPECWTLQLRECRDPLSQLALTIIEEEFVALTKRKASYLQKKYGLDTEQYGNILKRIQHLDPAPGYQYAKADSDYLQVDVWVSRIGEEWVVQLNPTQIPKISINETYRHLLQSAPNNRQYLQQHLQEAKWLIRSIQSRNQTLLATAKYLFTIQAPFLEKGAIAMQPLNLAQVAEQVGCHESTISRVTTQKFAQTPHGVFELKYFFSNSVSAQSGHTHSGTAIRARIEQIIEGENSQKPFSDAKIADILTEEGIDIARRTVAKYRESLNIPSSSERRFPSK